jgi:type IV pilus assembly protein PilM
MAKKILSIVIGNESTKVCEVSYKKNNKNKGIRVFRSISFNNPDNSIEDGFIKDINLFGEELRRQLKAGKLKSDKVIFSIASSKIANREIILPPTKDKKIMDIIKTGASEYFPIDIKDYILSYDIKRRWPYYAG